MQVARRLGGMTVGEMLERMSHVELTYWLILESIDPSGVYRDDLRSAHQTAVLVNLQIPGKHKKTEPKDFLLSDLLRKQHERSMRVRGMKERFDRKAFFQNIASIALPRKK